MKLKFFRYLDLSYKIIPLLLALILGVFIGKALPFTEAIDSKLSLMFDAVTAVTGLATVFLGYVIYRDMGVGKKRFELVSEFVEHLRGIVIVVQGMGSNGEPTSYKFSTAVDIHNVSDNLKHWHNCKVLVDQHNYFTNLKRLFELLASYYMPAKLKKDLTILSGVNWTSMLESKTDDESIRILASMADNVLITIQSDRQVKGPLMTMHQNKMPITLGDYLKRIQDTKDAATAWLEWHGG